MSDTELDDWIALCATMSDRPALATTARRQWKRLLDQTVVARSRRDPDPPRHG